MTDFFSKLFDTSGFPARWNCGNWDTAHGWIHIIGDTAIFGAYFAIPVTLLLFVRKKGSELMFPRIFWLFGAFIFFCGATHLVDAVIFFEPVYRFSGVMKLATAVVSWTTVLALLRVAPAAMELPGLKKANALLGDQIKLQEVTRAELEASNRELDEYTSVVSQDIRNPICSALFMAELAKESAARGDGVNLKFQLDQVAETLQRMDLLVSGLHVRAVDSGRVAAFAPVGLRQAVEGALANLVKPVADAAAVIKIGPLPVVSGDPILLTQLFTNLILGALKERSNHPTIQIQSREKEAWIEVTVSVKQDAAGGSGVSANGYGPSGLKGCRRIAGLHGAELVLESDEEAVQVAVRFPHWVNQRVQCAASCTP